MHLVQIQVGQVVAVVIQEVQSTGMEDFYQVQLEVAAVEWKVGWEPGLVSGCSQSAVVDLYLLSPIVAAFVDL
jgi:hypothetical protein